MSKSAADVDSTELVDRVRPSPSPRSFALPAFAAASGDTESYNCCAECCSVDPQTEHGRQSSSGHRDATPQDFALNRVFFGNGFWSDAWFHLQNNHTLLSFFYQHPNNPFSIRSRAATMLASLAFALMCTIFFSIYSSTQACALMTCSQCLRSNMNNQHRQAECEYSPTTWIGLSCEIQDFIVYKFRGGTSDFGGCAWFARRPDLWSNRYQRFMNDPGNGCLDPYYSGILPMTVEMTLLGVLALDSPFINRTDDPALHSFLDWRNPNASTSIVVTQDDGVCANLSAFAASTNGTAVGTTFDMDNDWYARVWRLVYEQVLAFVVMLFAKTLGALAQCKCSLRGNLRRCTTFGCRCAAVSCFSFMMLLSLAIFAAALALLSTVPGGSPAQWRAVLLFVLTKLFAFVYEVSSVFIFFSISYWLQSKCRSSRFAVCCCGCCGFGLMPQEVGIHYDQVHNRDRRSTNAVILDQDEPQFFTNSIRLDQPYRSLDG